MSSTDIRVEYFSRNSIANDFFQLVCGEQIGFGIGRNVFPCLIDNSLVVKFEAKGMSFQNAMEWAVWQHALTKRGSGIKKWIAPCVDISGCGTVLLQRKTSHINAKHLPKFIPAYFADTKPENWGLYQGRPVCHDYGYHDLMEIGMSKRMVKAKWD